MSHIWLCFIRLCQQVHLCQQVCTNGPSVEPSCKTGCAYPATSTNSSRHQGQKESTHPQRGGAYLATNKNSSRHPGEKLQDVRAACTVQYCSSCSYAYCCYYQYYYQTSDPRCRLRTNCGSANMSGRFRNHF